MLISLASSRGEMNIHIKTSWIELKLFNNKRLLDTSKFYKVVGALGRL